MTWIIVGASALVLFLLFARWYINAEPRDVVKVLRYIGVAFAIIIIGIAALSGRFGILWLILLSILPWLGRLRSLNRQVGNLKGPTERQYIDKRTKFLVLYLNKETGDMDGRVLLGPKSGKLLSELGVDSLVTLYEAAVIEDQESAKILETYLDRMHGQSWRSKSELVENKPSMDKDLSDSETDMTRSIAYEVLGLSPGASRNQIERAAKTLIEVGHPDEKEAEKKRLQILKAKETLLME